MGSRQQYEDREIDLRCIEFAIALKWTREANEPPVCAKAFGRHRRARLSQNRQGQRIEFGVARSAVTHSSRHPCYDYCAMLRGDTDSWPFNDPEIFGTAGCRSKKMSAVDQRRVRGEQLNWCHLNAITFANCLARVAVGLLGRVVTCRETDAGGASRFTRP